MSNMTQGGFYNREGPPSLRLPRTLWQLVEGYASGKGKGYYKVLANLEGQPNTRTADASLSVETGLSQKGSDTLVLEHVRDLRTGRGEGHGN